MSRGGGSIGAAARAGAAPGGTAIRGLIFYLLLLPALVLVVLALLRVRFAVAFWKRLYVVGLVYVAILLGRLLIQLVG
jgi:hypothetical protein